ncbi:MAG: DUF4390 domain-containing protein [Methylococcaceae bacterium]|nr:DUF4390 domain-containing protein [Methylococcaceae bacterium]
MNRGGAFLLVSLFFCAATARAADYGFAIRNSEALRSEQGYVLNTDIDYRFSPRAEDALKHGVPLTTVVKVRVNQYRRFIWNKTVFSRNLLYRLSYHALRKRYRVYDENLGAHQYFASLPSALESMGRIRDLPVLTSAEVQADAQYNVQIKVFLDIEALPLPLRSIAYLIPQWYISSGWYTWSLDELSRR